MNSTWVAHYDTGNIRWNQRVASRIGRDTTSRSKAHAGYYTGETWLGLTTVYGSRRDSNRYVMIQANLDRLTTLYLNRPGGSVDLLIRKSRQTTTHELGHTLCLNDNPNTSQVSIMKYTDVEALRTDVPTSYDIADVRRVYG